MTPKQAAAALGISESRVRKLITDGRLPATRYLDERNLPRWEINEEDLDRVKDRRGGRPRKQQP